MRTRKLIPVLVGTLLLTGATDLMAQRRTTGDSSGGSTTRSQPRGGDRRSGSSGGRDHTATRDNGRSTPTAPAASPSGTQAGTQHGRIAAVRSSARSARIRTSSGVRVVGGTWVGTCFDCNHWGWYGGYWGWYHGGWWYPASYPRYQRPYDDGGDDEAEELPPEKGAPAYGTTFLEHPYASAAEPGATFIQRDAPGRRGYGNLTAQYFGEQSSEVQAGRFALEYGYRLFHGEIGYDQYVEPVVGGQDRMHVWRAAVGVQPRLTERANLLAAVGVRGVNLAGGDDAYGPEGELGLQLLPFRPIGINLDARGAVLSWTGVDRFGFGELNATGSLFLGPVELQAGWHYMKLEGSPAFSGPVAGVRLWF